ncbi:MAG: hypothetical protein B7Y39_09085 [Bdellovibrio sp. 28-41-41]|nr:MAG: hypothetical protein B7Y39_09085 [Bdellovibrio sp. 28-41-41]
MKRVLTLVSLLIAFTSFSSWAAGDAGCGLGSVIISKNSKGLQLLAMTTNSFFLTQPLGITSGTSGCSSSGLVMKDKEIQYYVEVNQNEIIRQMSMGQGDKVETLASLYGCQTDSSKKIFIEVSRTEFGKIQPHSHVKPNEFIENLNQVINENSTRLADCHMS